MLEGCTFDRSQQASIRSCYLSKDEKDLQAAGYLQKCAFPEDGWVLMLREQLCAHGTARCPVGGVKRASTRVEDTEIRGVGGGLIMQDPDSGFHSLGHGQPLLK